MLNDSRRAIRAIVPTFAMATTIVTCVAIQTSAPLALTRGRQWPAERNMLDWLTRPADWLLSAGSFVASWFFSEDATSFTVVQMMFATLMLGAFLSLIVFWQTLVEYWWSLWKTR